MNVVLGNKNIEISAQEFKDLAKCYDEVAIDLGTGDGRFVYKNALEFKDVFYVGINPNASQLRDYSKKAVRKKLPNVMFVVGSIELIPEELHDWAQKIYINLPWGSLLSGVVRAETSVVENIKKLFKNGGILEMVVGYHENLEPSETERLKLPDLTENYINNDLAKKYEEFGFSLQKVEKLKKSELKKIETTWSKKLSFSKDRDVFRVVFGKIQ